jgi:hypothetical protein
MVAFTRVGVAAIAQRALFLMLVIPFLVAVIAVQQIVWWIALAAGALFTGTGVDRRGR